MNLSCYTNTVKYHTILVNSKDLPVDAVVPVVAPVVDAELVSAVVDGVLVPVNNIIKHRIIIFRQTGKIYLEVALMGINVLKLSLRLSFGEVIISRALDKREYLMIILSYFS